MLRRLLKLVKDEFKKIIFIEIKTWRAYFVGTIVKRIINICFVSDESITRLHQAQSVIVYKT